MKEHYTKCGFTKQIIEINKQANWIQNNRFKKSSRAETTTSLIKIKVKSPTVPYNDSLTGQYFDPIWKLFISSLNYKAFQTLNEGIKKESKHGLLSVQEY